MFIDFYNFVYHKLLVLNYNRKKKLSVALKILISKKQNFSKPLDLYLFTTNNENIIALKI